MKFLSLLFCCLLLVVLPARAGEHPRLLFGPGDVPALRKKITQEPFRTMFQNLESIAEKNQWGKELVSGGRPDYDESISAVRCALLYTLTGDDAWAKKARTYVERRLGDPIWANPKTKGLTLFINGKAVALTYDMCFGAPSWDEAFSAEVSRQILAMANVIFENGGAEQNRSPASNWQGLRWSVAGLMYLATDEPVEEKRITDAFNRTARYLADNLGSDKNSRGWNAEGLGYTYFPMANGVIPFAIALHRADPAMDLRKAVPGAAWTMWTTYAALVPTTAGLRRPDFSDDNPHAEGEGSYGFAFWFSDPALVPGMKYWYDRTVGAQGDKTFDRGRLGLLSSLLFYPDAVTAEDPMQSAKWREGFADTGGNGMQTWRNRYRDQDDLVAQFYVKLRGNRGHNGPDALTFRIAGLNTLWATGGGRYGKKAGGLDVYVRSMNTLYPGDPDGPLTISGESGRLIGAPQVLADGSGGVVSAIAKNNVGVRNQQRWFAASFAPSTAAEGAFVVCDTSDDGQVWQMCTLETNTITTDGASFTITSPDGHSLRGTVLYPASGVTFTTGVRDRGSNAGDVTRNGFVHFPTPDGCAVVALTIVKKGASHPAVSATGTWGKSPAGTVQIGQAKIAISAEALDFSGAR